MDKNELSALEKFTLLPNLNIVEPDGDYIVVNKEKDEGYTPTLYYYDEKYVLDWIGEDHDTIKDFNDISPEEVISKAFAWCVNEHLL